MQTRSLAIMVIAGNDATGSAKLPISESRFGFFSCLAAGNDLHSTAAPEPEREESRTRHTDLARVSRLLGTCQPVVFRGPFGNRTRSPSVPRRRAAGTPTDHLHSDPGWNRTSTFLVVTQASSPLDHGIVLLSVTEVGLEPTGTRLSTSPLCHFAYPVISCGSGGRTERSRLTNLRSVPGPVEPSPTRELQAPVSSRANRPYESQLGTCRACNDSVTKGRFELPSPYGHDVLSVARLPVAPLGHSAARAGIEPASPA